MKPSPCPRLFEVEAMRDGRLGDAERASFERHLTGCAACSSEAEAIDALAAALGGPADTGDTDELHVRRERTRLLAAFDGTLVAPQRPSGFPYRLLGPAAVAMAIAAIVVASRSRPAAPPVAVTSAVVRPGRATVWSERTEGDVERVRLEHGSLWIHVDHTSARRHQLVVVLPDGELEDTGTTFTVSAEDGRTTRVTVQDGSVTLRVRGEAAVSLGPGDTWTPVVAPMTPPSSAPVAAGEPPVAALSTLPASIPSSLAPTAAASVTDPAAEFRAAMAALDTGDNRRAARGFASFLARHPGESRAEDAAYLEVIALQRCGDRAAMRVAGEEYLKRFPGGFRHAEVEALLE